MREYQPSGRLRTILNKQQKDAWQLMSLGPARGRLRQKNHHHT